MNSSFSNQRQSAPTGAQEPVSSQQPDRPLGDAACCASSISGLPEYGNDLSSQDRGRWWKAPKWSDSLCELEFLHLLEWCNEVKSMTGKMWSSDQEVEAMLSLWQSWHRPHPSNVRDEFLAPDDRDIRKRDFGNWSLRVWEGFLAQRQSDGTAVPGPESSKNVNGGCHARLV